MNVYIAGASFAGDDSTIPARYGRELRRADSFITSGVVVVDALLGQMQERLVELDQECGICLGSCFGPMDTNFDVLEQVISREQTSPTLFSHSVFNAAAGYLARIFTLRGPALSITDFCFPLFQALQQAALSIQSGRLSSCLVVQIESYSPLLHDARKLFCNNTPDHWPTGACGLFLSDRPINEMDMQMHSIELDLTPAQPESHLCSHGQLQLNGAVSTLTSPLDSGRLLSLAMADNTLRSLDLQLHNGYCTAHLSASRVSDQVTGDDQSAGDIQ